MAHIATTVEIRGVEFGVEVYGNVTTGGSNFHGSDEPEWADVEIEEIQSYDGKPLPRRLGKAVMAKFGEDLEQLLIDSGDW